jgi:hypothetical protein
MRLVDQQKGFTLLHVFLVIVITATLSVAGYSVWQRQNANDKSNVARITNFDECVAAGNPVMEIYPEQCNANGQIFTKEYKSGKLSKSCKLDGVEMRGKTFIEADGVYTSCMPNGWLFTYTENDIELPTGFIIESTYDESKEPELKFVGGRGGYFELSTSVYNSVGKNHAGYVYGLFEHPRHDVGKFQYIQPGNGNGDITEGELPGGTVNTQYQVDGDKYQMAVNYLRFPGQPDKTAQVEAYVRTIHMQQ